MKINLFLLFNLVLFFSCGDSIYEIERSNFKVFKIPYTEIHNSVKVIDDKNVVIKEFGFNKTDKPSAYYAGLTPNYPMIQGYYINKEIKPCLFENRGMILTCMCLVIKVGGEYVLINSLEKFNHYFLPIQNKQEAISYLNVLTNSYPIYDFKFVKKRFRIKKNIIYKTFVDSLPEAYRVNLFENGTLGCYHPYFEITYKLYHNGKFEVLKKEEIFSDPKEDGLCAD